MKSLLSLLISGIMLTSSAYASFQIPAMEEEVLPNGLKIIYIPQAEVPLVHITVTIKSGSVEDNGNWGLASMSSAGIDLGTKSYSKKQIEDAFDQNAFSLETSISKEFLTIDVSSASEDLEKLIPYLGELVRFPQYPDKEFVKLRDRSVAQLKRAKESPNQIATEVFDRMLFQGHPYSRTNNGVVESLKSITSSQVKSFHKVHYQPQLSAVIVAGDFNKETLRKDLIKAFGTWEKGNTQASQVAPFQTKINEPKVLILDKPDARETTFRIGGKGLKNFAPHWPKITVLNTVLGGRFTSLLNDALRAKSGYTYGAGSRFNEYKSDGSFFITSFTANETSFKAVDLAIETYKKFVDQGIDQKTLDSAKAYVKGQFPPNYETLEGLSSLAAELWVHEQKLQDFNRFEAEVDSLTLDEANRLIKETFPKDALQILLIGKASELRKEAVKYGTLKFLPITAIESMKSF